MLLLESRWKSRRVCPRENRRVDRLSPHRRRSFDRSWMRRLSRRRGWPEATFARCSRKSILVSWMRIRRRRRGIARPTSGRRWWSTQMRRRCRPRGSAVVTFPVCSRMSIQVSRISTTRPTRQANRLSFNSMKFVDLQSNLSSFVFYLLMFSFGDCSEVV